ncbi:MAG: VanZ family protein [Pyrinomonadaceae bacterium]
MNTQSLAGQRDKQSFRRRVSRYAPLILWMGFISFASTGEFSAVNTSRIIRPILLWLFPNISNESLALVHVLVRKAAHFGEYAVLGFFAARASFTSSHQFLRSNWSRWSVVLIAGYALLDEYQQSFVPTRTASVYDSLIDTAGGLTALVIYAAWIRRRGRNREADSD